MKKAILIQARLNSSRFPKKMLKKLGEFTLVEYVYNRCLASKETDLVGVITSLEKSDDELANLCKSKNIPFYRGNLNNVLDRYIKAGEFLTIEQIPQKVAESIIDFTNNKYAVLGILNVFLLIIGFFLHSVAAIILTVPIVMPLVNAVGIDPVHFGIIVTLNLAIGQQTPPVASVLVTACSVAKADIWDVTRSNISFICVLLVLLMLVTYVPAIPMTLVEFFYRS